VTPQTNLGIHGVFLTLSMRDTQNEPPAPSKSRCVGLHVQVVADLVERAEVRWRPVHRRMGSVARSSVDNEQLGPRLRVRAMRLGVVGDLIAHARRENERAPIL
jgi:hypothetical protein